MSNKNIFQRVAAITAELGAIAKDLTVGEGDKAYSATSEATILAAVKPLEGEARRLFLRGQPHPRPENRREAVYVER